MYTLGLWDGHDSGAALIQDNKILFASNEERYTKRKLEVKFPRLSIAAALQHAGIRPTDVENVAFPTTEFTKTLSRVFPFQKEAYYKFRRRKMLKPRTEALMHYTKYGMTSIGVLPLCEPISKYMVSRELKHMGFRNFNLDAVEHHASHAATAAFTSGMKKSLVITMDGLGDGLSGSISILDNGTIERVHSTKARDSLGIFYEQVTNILGMRELEDEGKIMAMADYSFPFDPKENKLKDFFEVKGLEIRARYGPLSQYNMLSRIAWGTPREQIAYMAQQLLENVMEEYASNAISQYGIDSVAFAGGLMSNIKANMRIRQLPSLKNWYVFPHMGDGGIALGAAMYSNYDHNDVSSYAFANSYLGDDYDPERIKVALERETGISFEEEGREKCAHASDLINDDNYILWFQGRMEYGPRALGNRSILAHSGSDTVKEKLNMYVKQREWFQPFAPSMLVEEAQNLLEDVKGYDRFMTMGYRVKNSRRDIMRSVAHIDNTARPQMVGDENPTYRELLKRIKAHTGYGVVLNTSFNIHGMPIVQSPEDALLTLKKTRSRHMFLGDFYVENKDAPGAD